MDGRPHVFLLAGVTAFALTAGGSPAAAKPKPVTGKLSQRGYTVIAVSANGTAKSDRVPRRRFRVPTPAKVVSLHLRAPNGRYAGPVVVGRRKAGRRAIVGVRAGARLGAIEVKRRRGLAKPRKLSKRQTRRWVVAKRWARAKRGVPIGAGRYGFVRSRNTRDGVPGDRDIDGIANPLDIDANGNLVLDKYERPKTGRAAQVDEEAELEYSRKLNLTSSMLVTLRETANANATELTPADIDATLSERGYLWIGYPENERESIFPEHEEITFELDCGGLIYCSPGGTGKATTPTAAEEFGPPRSWPGPFPDCCDSDGDGRGELSLVGEPEVPSHGFRQVYLSHGATTDQIGTGDVLLRRVIVDGAEGAYQFPSTVQDVFATVPALVSYDDSAGSTRNVAYPLPAPYVGSPPDYWSNDPYSGLDRWPRNPPGFEGLPVRSECVEGSPAPCVDPGDVVLTLSFWRPQRKAIAGEPGDWTDIGGLVYSVLALPGKYNPTQPYVCRQQDYATADTSLAPAPGEGAWDEGAGGFRDRAPDRAANAGNTLTMSVNVSQCIGRSTTDPEPFAQPPTTWNVGEHMPIWLAATIGADPDTNRAGAIQQLYFKREG